MKITSNLILTESEIIKFGSSIEKVQDSLTLPNPEYQNMLRFSKGRFYKKIDKYICYLQKEGSQYILPRYYFGNVIGGNNGRTLDNPILKVTPRDYQQKFFTDNSDTLESWTGILLEAACGSGKTYCGIYLSLKIKKQTMIFVPTYYLAKQWAQRISDFTDCSSFILTSKDKEIPVDSDFTIVVLDLFTCRDLPKKLIENVGCVILDEAHRVGAEVYLPIMNSIPAKHRIALTATFRRNDNVHKILAYHFGSHLKMESRFPRPVVYTILTHIRIRNIISKNRPYENFLDFLDTHGVSYNETTSGVEFIAPKNLMGLVDESYKKGEINKTRHRELCSVVKKSSDMSYPVIDSYLNTNSKRRKIAIRLIQAALDSGRTILFLSKRKDTLKAMYKYFTRYNPVLIVSETSKRTEEEDNYLQNSCRLVLGVNQLAKEGLDIDRLDTLIMWLPIRDTEQAIGRISRLCKGKKTPTAFYLLDDCPITYAVFANSQKFMAINSDYKGNVLMKNISEIL